jgi:peptide/nickel transport system substrate-binding protein
VVDRVVFRVINDFDAALAARKAGAVDFMGLRPVQYLKQTNDPRFDEQSVKHQDRAGSYTYLGWNQKRAIFQDKRVRQALSHLVDKRNVCDKLLLGLADPVESPISGQASGSSLPPGRSTPRRQGLLTRPAGPTATATGSRQGGRRRARALGFRSSNSGNDDRRTSVWSWSTSSTRGGRRQRARLDEHLEKVKVRLRRGDPGLADGSDAAGRLPDLALVAGRRGRIQPRRVQEPRGRRLLEAYRVDSTRPSARRSTTACRRSCTTSSPTWVYAPKSLSAYDRRFQGVTWYPTGATQETEWWVPVASQKYR